MVDPAVVWPAEHIDALRVFFADGMSASQTAAALNEKFRGYGYSRSAVCGKINRLGMSGQPDRQKGGGSNGRERKTKPAPGPAVVTIAKPVPAIPVPAASDVVPRHLPLVDLKHGDCRYPYGDGPFTFCGHRKLAGAPYCMPHFLLSRKSGAGM